MNVMGWTAKLFQGARYEIEWGDSSSHVDHQTADTLLEMASAMTFALQIRNEPLRFVEHCARVTATVDALADALDLDSVERADLHAAAQLHEIGMLAVPPELVESPFPLERWELDQIRAQAAIGAELVRATQSERTARLIEHQYTDFAEIRREFAGQDKEILMAGILRVADAFDAMTHPRPYQRNLPDARRAQILLDGRGTRFDPQVVETMLRIQSGSLN